MGQHQNQNEAYAAERQALLSNLDTQVARLDTNIASLVAERNTLERARRHILLTSTTTNRPDDKTPQTRPLPKSPLVLTYRTSFNAAKRAPSSLRQQILVHNATERDKSSSPPDSVGLLPSDEFEAAFDKCQGHNSQINDNSNGNDGGDCGVRASIECSSSPIADTHSAPSATTAANANTQNNMPSSANETSPHSPQTRTARGAHWKVKQAAKRRLQENAARAREVWRKTLEKRGSAAI